MAKTTREHPRGPREEGRGAALQNMLREMECWEQFFCSVDQRGAPHQSFFVAAAALNSMAREVPHDPNSHACMAYPADHPARLHTAMGVRDLMVDWMLQEPGQQLYPPGDA